MQINGCNYDSVKCYLQKQAPSVELWFVDPLENLSHSKLFETSEFILPCLSTYLVLKVYSLNQQAHRLIINCKYYNLFRLRENRNSGDGAQQFVSEQALQVILMPAKI